MGTKAWVGLALAICLGATLPAVAADWSMVPSVTQRSEFNSNINMNFRDPISDYILSLRPAVDFNYTTEISQLQGHLGLFGQHYITESQLDHIDQNYQINGRYQALPRLNLSLNSSFISDTTLTQELLASGLVISRTPRQAFWVNPGVTYNITERLLGTASYNFNRLLYQDPDYTDYTSHQAGLNFTYLLKNEKTTLISNNIVRETLYAGGNNFKSLGFYFGATHKITERWDATIITGLNISFFKYNTQVVDFGQAPFFVRLKTATVQDSNVTPYVNLSTSYRWTKLTVNAGFSRDLVPSAYGAIYEYNRLTLSGSYRVTERLNASLTGSFSLSNQSGQNLASKYDYYSVSPQLTYKITEKLSVSPGYRFNSYEDLTGARGTALGHMAWVQFSYTYPMHYQK